MKKRLISIWLMSTMIVTMLSGCGKTEENNTSEASATSEVKQSEASQGTEEKSDDAVETIADKYPRNEQGYPDLQGETFTIWFAMTQANVEATSDLGEYYVIKELEEKFNCNFEFIHPPLGQEKENFTIMMADELPDMIFCNGIDSYYPGGVVSAYEDGVLFDYTEYINEENTPNFYNLLTNDEFVATNAYDDKGRIIRLGAKICGSDEFDFYYGGPIIRSDYLADTGLDVPTTIDDWTEMLAAMKDNGVQYPFATYGTQMLSITDGVIFSAAYGISTSYYLKEDGTISFGPYEDAYKDYLTLLNQWYEAGYINPDFTTQTNNDARSLMMDAAAGSTIQNGNFIINMYYPTVEAEDESKALIPAPIPVLKEGDTPAPVKYNMRSLGDNKYITADAKNPEACIALLDALYLEDINMMMTNGVEGVAYDMVDGYPVLKTIGSDAPTEVKLSCNPTQWNTFEDTDKDYILKYKYNRSCIDDGLLLWENWGTEGALNGYTMYQTTEESEITSKYSADLNTYVSEMSMKFITGVEPLDKFEEYQETLKEYHIEELITVKQNAFDRLMAR